MSRFMYDLNAKSITYKIQPIKPPAIITLHSTRNNIFNQYVAILLIKGHNSSKRYLKNGRL